MLTERLMSFDEARAILDSYCHMLDGKPASTNTRVHQDRNVEASERSWWLENQGNIPPHDTPRSRAYLFAYLEIGGAFFSATGIPLTDGYLWPDKGMMKSMMLSDCVVLGGPHGERFELTDVGRRLLTASHPI